MSRAGRHDEARIAYQQAIDLTTTSAERGWLKRQCSKLKVSSDEATLGK
jgi:predicted RNA polymerase sigma factor